MSSLSQQQLSFQSAVIAVGSTPESIIGGVPGAMNYTQPFYTREHAIQTQELLEKLSKQSRPPKIAVVGGGYGGVELAACVKRRISKGSVALLTRTPPLEGTRAEPLVNQALSKLGVTIELCGVKSITKKDDESLQIQRTNNENDNNDDEICWDAILWTAGSGPCYPVSNNNNNNNKFGSLGLERVSLSGRLKVDNNLRCSWGTDETMNQQPATTIWALGDCAEMVNSQPAVPKTASAAIQQADVVANNILHELSEKNRISSTSLTSYQTFEFQDLGMMMSLGGPNAAILAPTQDDSIFKPLFTPLLDISRVGLGVADQVMKQVISKSPEAESLLNTKLGLSFGGYGLGVDTESTPGTLAGTLAGAARRAVYAVRMPTNQQRVYAAVSAALSTANALAKES
eukprot:CAMPEP_0194175004 /NCGR_PEP_ID=MMETSP0154-20130528/9123_1 /TAXON_ID=1049557 /ORGANISM="Thalassiothrix antarctica, Strain L6-D1" /LENGTH=400 /DNA_ID=CAMNT_0038888655 /DNA_START=491 /DNA_END=1690 /DNA_ORIENTATION=+